MEPGQSQYTSPHYIQRLIQESESLLGATHFLRSYPIKDYPSYHTQEAVIRETKDNSHYEKDGKPSQDPFFSSVDPKILRPRVKTIEISNTPIGENKQMADQGMDSTQSLTETVKRSTQRPGGPITGLTSSHYNIDSPVKQVINRLGESEIRAANYNIPRDSPLKPIANRDISSPTQNYYGEMPVRPIINKTNERPSASHFWDDSMKTNEQKAFELEKNPSNANNNAHLHIETRPIVESNIKKAQSPVFIESHIKPVEKLSPASSAKLRNESPKIIESQRMDVKDRRITTSVRYEPQFEYPMNTEPEPLQEIEEIECINNHSKEKLKQSSHQPIQEEFKQDDRNNEEIRELENRIRILDEDFNGFKEEWKMRNAEKRCELKPALENLDLEVQTVKQRIIQHVEFDHRVVKPTSWCC